MVKSVSVCRRPDNSLWVSDGQHTIYLCELAGIDEVPCSIVNTTGSYEEARYFSGINTNRRNQTSTGKYRADLHSGSSFDANEVNRVLTSLGLNLAENFSLNEVGCIGTLRGIVSRYTSFDNMLELTLTCIASAFPTDTYRFNSDMIHGSASFISQAFGGSGVTEKDIVSKFSSNIGDVCKKKRGGHLR